MADELRQIGSVGPRVRLPGRAVKPAEAAHFWYAQLPASHRNANGLRLLKKLHEQDLKEALAADVVDESVVRDIGTAINKLDALIKNPPRVSPRAIEALKIVGEDSADTYIRAGILNPEDAAARPGLLARALGLAPDGTEAYIGHRADRVLRQRPSGLPGNTSTGKVLRPEGVGRNQQNRLRRVRGGTVRQDLRVAVEDWRAAQVYEFHNLAREELGRMGRAFDGTYSPATDVIVNPQGHKIPRALKSDGRARALAEDFDVDEVVVADAAEYLGNYLAEGAAIPALISKAEQLGLEKGLRVVPKDVVGRYFSQFLPTKIHAATPGVKQGAGVVGKTFDTVNDAVYLSLIFSAPGYIPANTLANALMATAQQGLFLPANIARAGQVLTRGPQDVRDMIRAEVSHGPTVAIASETSPLRHVGSAISRVADEPWRVSAWLNEMARVGVISRVSPRLSKREWDRLRTVLTDKQYRPLLNDVWDRGRQAMIDFERAGSKEKAVAKRFLFVWSFLRGATRYPARFALDHPIRTAAAAGAAYHYRDDIRGRIAEGMPSWLEGSIEAGETEVGGKTFPQVLPTRSFSPLSTPWEMIGSAVSRPGANTLTEFLHPGLRAAYMAGDKQDSFGSKAGSYREALGSHGQRLVPQYGLTRDLLSPEPGGLYPEDATRTGRLKRASRVLPIAVDPEEAAQARQYERSETITLPRVDRKTLQERTVKRIRDEARVAKKLKWPLPKAVVESLKLAEMFEESRATLTRNLKVEKLTGRQKVAADMQVAQRVAPGVVPVEQVKRDVRAAKTEKQLQAISDAIRLAVDHAVARKHGFDPTPLGQNRASSVWEKESNAALEELAVGNG
jgi:hypothetical protein